jgi:hypothetical protein
MRWWVVALLAVAGCAVGLLVGLGLGSTSAGPSAAGLSPAQLQQAKLQQEVRQLQISNQQNASLQHTLLDWAPFITGLGAIAAVGATLWKQATDLESARTETRVANEQWQERFLEDQRNSRMREQENSLRRFDASLSMVISNLGSSSETRQVNAAAALGTYLRPRYAAMPYRRAQWVRKICCSRGLEGGVPRLQAVAEVGRGCRVRVATAWFLDHDLVAPTCHAGKCSEAPLAVVIAQDRY